MEQFHLTQNGMPVGPWSVDQILQNLKSNHLSWTDYLYDEAKKEWVLLLDHALFIPHFRQMSAAPLVAIQPEAEEASSAAVMPEPPAMASLPDLGSAREKEWFCLKGDNKYGPFAALEIVKMLQDKNLFEYDYVWNVRFTNWKRVSECEDFQPDRVRALRDSGHAEVEDIFFRRRHVRARYGASLIVHNSKHVWKAESLEISSGGCGLMIEQNDLEPGQSLFLHFKAGDGVPPFNAICQVVSKQAPYAGQKWVKYGVKFTSISRQVQLAIKDFTTKAA